MTLWKWSPLIGAALWGGWKLLSWGVFPWETSAQVGALMNLFILLMLALGGAWVAMQNQEEHPDFLSALRAVSLAPFRFALVVTGGLIVWYSTVAADGLEVRRERLRSEAIALVGDDVQWQAFVEAQGGGAWDREKALQQQLDTIDTIFNPRLFIGLSLLGLVVASLVCSAVATVLWRSVWTK
jgi:hypothetical protein